MGMDEKEEKADYMDDVHEGSGGEDMPSDSDENQAVADEEFSLDLKTLQALQEEVADSQKKAGEYLDGWQRSRAEFANYKKRVERDQAQVYQQAVGSIVRRYLEILDDLERALRNRPAQGEGAAWAAGIELIYKKFCSLLEAEGIVQMEAEGQIFDPNFHEAITQEESREHGSGHIIEVVQQGYLIGDRVLRPALVRVAR